MSFHPHTPATPNVGFPEEGRIIRLKDAAVVLLIYILFQVLTVALGDIFVRNIAWQAALPLFGSFVALLGVAAAGRGVLGVGIFERRLSGFGLARISKVEILRYSAAGALMGGAVAFLTYVYPHTGATHSPAEIFLTNGFGVRALWAVTAIVVAPMVEEYVFRGFILSAAANKVGVPAAIFASAAAFLAMHLPQVDAYWVAIVSIGALGIFCGVARFISQSLLAPIVLHASYNAVGVLGVFLQS